MPPTTQQKLVTCRVCKVVCAEEPNDPNPGICHICLSRWMHKEFPNGEVPHTNDPVQLQRIRRILKAMGWRDAALPPPLRSTVVDGSTTPLN